MITLSGAECPIKKRISKIAVVSFKAFLKLILLDNHDVDQIERTGYWKIEVGTKPISRSPFVSMYDSSKSDWMELNEVSGTQLLVQCVY
jgi:hypothetical protein